MKNKITYTAISIFMVPLAWGMDIELTDETILRDVTVAEVNIRGIELLHSDGGQKVLPEMIAESDQSKLKEHIARYRQLVGNKKITSAIQEARRSGSINAAIPILEQAIKSAPEAANIAKAKKLLASLKKKSKSDVTMALITVANEKELSTAIEIMEKAVAENSFAENLEQAKKKLAELKKRSVAIAANGEAPDDKNSSKREQAAELAEKGRQRILREQRASSQRRQRAVSSFRDRGSGTGRSSVFNSQLSSLRSSIDSRGCASASGYRRQNTASGGWGRDETSGSDRFDRTAASGYRRQNAVSGGRGRNETSGSDPRPVHERIAKPLNQDSTPYCLRCGGSGRITQVTMPSEGALISAAFGGQQATARQSRRTCPTCGGSGKRY